MVVKKDLKEANNNNNNNNNNINNNYSDNPLTSRRTDGGKNALPLDSLVGQEQLCDHCMHDLRRSV